VRVQTEVAGSGIPSFIASTRHIANDLDFLTARLHARHSRMAEAERLDSLCHIRNLPEFYSTIFPKSEIKDILDFQKLSVHELIGELSGFRTYMSGQGADLLDWMLVRFQMENMKVLIRACLTKAPIENIEGHLIPLPRELTLDNRRLAAAESPEDFIRLLPKSLLRESLVKMMDIYSDYPRTFFFEAVLDRYYFYGLLSRMERLSQEDREIVKPMFCQEVDIFHFMLVARGKFHYGLTPEMLRPLHVAGSRISRALFAAMLNDTDIYTSVDRVAKRVLDTTPFEHSQNDGTMNVDASTFEGLLWNRFFRLAGMAFRQSHMGLGAVIGYAGLRRVEVANLITISEGIRTGMAAETIRKHLIPRFDLEGAYV
jgi:V/A-type H+/Na+-transporting ATPase subunit C